MLTWTLSWLAICSASVYSRWEGSVGLTFALRLSFLTVRGAVYIYAPAGPSYLNLHLAFAKSPFSNGNDVGEFCNEIVTGEDLAPSSPLRLTAATS